MTDLPVWIQAAGQAGEFAVAATSLYLGIRNSRQRAALEWASLLQELSGLTPDQLQSIVEDTPAIAELVGTAWESAARSAAIEKRWMLARAVANAIKSPPDEEIDPYPQLVRTIGHVEFSEAKLLTIVARPRPGEGKYAFTRLEGALTRTDLQREWPGAANLLAPMLAVLESEGLIDDVAAGTWDYDQPAWRLSGYGRRFLELLPGDTSWLAESEVSAVLQQDRNLIVLNLGPGNAHRITLSDLAPPDVNMSTYMDGQPPDPFDLGPGQERSVALRPPIEEWPPPYRLTVIWEDSASKMRDFEIDTVERHDRQRSGGL